MGKLRRKALVLVSSLLLASCAEAQTRLSTPVIIQRKSTATVAPGQLVFPNSANIDCVAANYATCKPAILQNNDSTGDLTLTNPTGTNTRLFLGTAGSVVGSDQFSLWRAGGTGPRAQLLPGGALGSGRLHLGNTDGTFYTGFIADPAMTASSLYQMPLADGTSAQCLKTNGSAVLSWSGCVYDTLLTNLSAASYTISWTTGTNIQSSQVQIYGGGVARTLLWNGGTLGSGSLRFWNTAGDRYWGLKASTATTGTSTDWTLPTADGAAGECLSTDGAGALSWAACSGGSSPPFVDTTAISKGSSDATKLLRFEVDGFTTATARTLTPQDASYVIAGTNITQTFSQNQTFGANILFSTNNTYNIGSAPTGTTRIAPANIYAWTQVESPAYRVTYISAGSIADYFDITTTSNTLYFKDSSSNTVALYTNVSTPTWDFRGKVVPSSTSTYDLGSTSAKWQNAYVNNFIGATYQISGAVTGRCLNTNGSGYITEMAADCVTTARTISTNSPLSGGGDLSANRTLSCPTCVTSVTGTSPIVSSGGTTPAISCSTCVTTTGSSQTLSGDFSITGNWYARSFSGSAISCSGVADGWMGWDYTNQYLIMCAGGARYRVNLASY